MNALCVPVGATITFTEGERSPRTWKGTVISHDEDGALVSWPTMRYQKVKGVTCHHTTFAAPWFDVTIPGEPSGSVTFENETPRPPVLFTTDEEVIAYLDRFIDRLKGAA